ncbi:MULTISPECIES: hypothetical protein [unclassified Pseudomonas]|uniref:hypothetical protein n=1 Tax=unclassified Pseudomonas TaxID=196821 RepID=UPI00244C549D|nr:MULTISPECIES: hypothetical protein [unclassified Pseudomonas]MDH0894608.1 hypothetical protein [Pseudomonas sp. GD03875]MDH1063097.1 hypothetical protein [Pseudomonas sp. GD03985]
MERLGLLKSSDYEWAVNYLLSRVDDQEIAKELRSSNRDYSSIRNAINLLERTDDGNFLIVQMQTALRQRRNRELRKRNKSLIFTLPQETANQIRKIAKRENITEIDAITISITELNEITEFHSQQIKKIRAKKEQRNIQLREDIRSYEKRLETALEILEKNIRQLLNTEMITSKPLSSSEEIEKLEEEVNKELDKRMRAARKYIEASGVIYGRYGETERY